MHIFIVTSFYKKCACFTIKEYMLLENRHLINVVIASVVNDCRVSGY